MANCLVTGGSGFLGSLLLRRLLRNGHSVVNIDLAQCPLAHERLTSITGDIRNRTLVDTTLRAHPCEVVFHLAAILAHGSVNMGDLWLSNVEGARTLAEAVKATGIPLLVYTSSNCLWGREFPRPIQEEDAPEPIEPYGQSKWEGERILSQYANDFATITIRCPTIIDEGRLGLLSILFEFIDEGRKVWVVGGGSNRYQFIYAQDLIDAMLAAWRYARPSVFGIGADDVRSLRETYEYVIREANSRSKVVSLPRSPTVAAMKLAYRLRLSPLGPYQYQMIASNFSFDTTRIKNVLNWRPTLSNHEMLARSYLYFQKNRKEIESRIGVSPHRRSAEMGLIRVLKWLS